MHDTENSASIGDALSTAVAIVAPTTYVAERAAVDQLVGTEAWQKISWMESVIEAHPESFRELPLTHTFSPGLYCRTIHMPKGVLLTSRVHLTEHPYFIMKGAVSVWDDAEGWVLKKQNDRGITKPGTRRILFIHEDCDWMTVHANPSDEQDPQKIVEAVTYDHKKLQTPEAALV